MSPRKTAIEKRNFKTNASGYLCFRRNTSPDLLIVCVCRGGLISWTTQAVVEGVGLVGRTLYVIGTDEKDNVEIEVNEKRQEVEVDAKFDNNNKSKKFEKDFDAADIDQVIVHLFEGDDRYEIKQKSSKHDPAIVIPQLIFGGAGDDRVEAKRDYAGSLEVHGQAGDDIIVGGGGDDRIKGGRGSDLLIGGTGADNIRGNSGGDLLIGGFTNYDQSLDDLMLLRAEWTSQQTYQDRVRHLRSGSGPILDGEGIRLQGSGADATVFDDDEQDRLSGVVSDARRTVEAKYADQWNAASLVRRWKLQRMMNHEIKELAAKLMPEVSSDAMF